jgi:hypothetical protein
MRLYCDVPLAPKCNPLNASCKPGVMDMMGMLSVVGNQKQRIPS